MRVIAIRGTSGSGKTETAVALAHELRRRGYLVVTAKDVHKPGFSIDTPGKDSWRLSEASGEAVIVRASEETSFIFRRRLSPEEIVTHVDADYLILEGFRDVHCPNIVCAHDEASLAAEIDELTIAASGKVAGAVTCVEGVPAISAMGNPQALADIVETKVPPLFANSETEDLADE